MRNRHVSLLGILDLHRHCRAPSLPGAGSSGWYDPAHRDARRRVHPPTATDCDGISRMSTTTDLDGVGDCANGGSTAQTCSNPGSASADGDAGPDVVGSDTGAVGAAPTQRVSLGGLPDVAAALIASIVVVVAFGRVVLDSNRGIDITDEGMYLWSADPPQPTDLFHAGRHFPAVSGDLQPLRKPGEQLDADAPLQLLQPAGHRRGVDAKFRCRPTDGARPGNSRKITVIVPVPVTHGVVRSLLQRDRAAFRRPYTGDPPYPANPIRCNTATARCEKSYCRKCYPR